MKLRRMLCSFLIIAILSVQFDVPVKANRDYLNITLADIIIAWYNASGVAIGSSELFNGIQDTYGSITLNDLVENDCFMLGGYLENEFAFDKDAIREMIGYGSLAAPAIGVRPDKLMLYLQGFPLRESARDSLRAMFGNVTGDDLPTEYFAATLGFVIGMVANLGKIGNDIDQAVIQNIGNYWQKLNEWWPVKTLKGVYRKFTDSTYFQDLLKSDEPEVPSGDLILNFTDNGYDGIAGVGDTRYCTAFRLPRNFVPVAVYYDSTHKGYAIYIFNFSGSEGTFEYSSFIEVVNNTLNASSSRFPYRETLSNDSGYHVTSRSGGQTLTLLKGGYALIYPGEGPSQSVLKEWARENNPWGSGGSGGSGSTNGVTNYINKSVGNIASDNYINLSPNIGNNEYMYIFDRLTYIEELNQITQNTDNGDYSQNSSVINNYNNQYIQGGVPDVRPTSAPASNPEVLPEMPFVSPRPTQPPEFVEQVVQEGGLSEEITKKFPFCIPWDIKALVDNLWAPEARAPYIHWEAIFGEWGKLGEVTVDFSEFDSVARIFRSTTLLLWIVGLVLITRDLIG